MQVWDRISLLRQQNWEREHTNKEKLPLEVQSLSKISFRPLLRAVSEMNLRCRRPDQKTEQHQISGLFS